MVVETVGQAGKWKIDLLGDKAPLLTRKGLRQACVNDLFWRSGLETDDQPVSSAPITFQRDRYRATFPGFGDELSFTCVADLFRDNQGGVHLNLSLPGDAAELRALNPSRFEEKVRALRDPLRRAGAPLWYIHPPETKLRSLATR